MTPRSWLSVPASSARKLEKARDAAADGVVLDLEDAVVPAAKDDAREALVAALADAAWTPTVGVRINAPGSPWCHRDLIALGALPASPAVVVVPKVESPGDLLFVDRLLDGIEHGGAGAPRIRTHALIESARGLGALGEIAGCSRRLAALVVGYADLAVSLRRPSGAGDDVTVWDPVRHAVLTAARANGLQAIDGPHLGVAPDGAFEADARRAHQLGFDAKWVIHPGQVEPLHALFAPTAEQVAQAERVLAALAEAERAGAGAVALDGQMLDEPVRLAALETLERALR